MDTIDYYVLVTGYWLLVTGNWTVDIAYYELRLIAAEVRAKE